LGQSWEPAANKTPAVRTSNDHVCNYNYKAYCYIVRMNCYLIDDEQHSIDLLTNYLGRLEDFMIVGTNLNAKKALIEINMLNNVDMVFTDIYMPELSAIFEKKVGCKYNHAQLYLGGSSYIHSYDLGVQAANPARDLFELTDDAVALRIKGKGKEKMIQAAVDSACAKIGTQYSMSEARAALRKPDIEAKEGNRQICIRLVAQAFGDADLKIVDNADYCSTKDLLESVRSMS
jgi:hypothetical protein